MIVVVKLEINMEMYGQVISRLLQIYTYTYPE